MRTLEQVDELRDQLIAEGTPKPDAIRQIALATLDWPYVFGAWGEKCTAQNRKRRLNDNHPTIKQKCPALNGKTCADCKWGIGVRMFDCRGFTRWLLQQVDLDIAGQGATSQYNTNANWIKKGPISEMPDQVCCVFKQVNGKTMEHTGMHIGGGTIIHCSVNVQTGRTSDKGWTHYAIPVGLYDEPKTENDEEGGDATMSNIKPDDLINLFRQAHSEKWGYIGGKAGQLWTEAAQSAAETAYRNGDMDNEATAKYGRQWVGKRVADCSGLFSWAFKQLGGYMYHGQNTMWSKYTINKGTLQDGKRTDGQFLKPGTAVFKVRDTDYYHVGLYIGGGTVIESQGTRVGVVTSSVSKWHTWGELKGVAYEDTSSAAATTDKPAAPVAEVKPVTVPTTTKRGDVPMVTGNAMVVADGGVNLRAERSTKSAKLAVIPKGTYINAEKVDDTWSSTEFNGRKGYVASQYISYNTDAASEALFNEQMQIIANIESELARLKSLLGA